MKKRFFFYRIVIDSTGISIGQAVKLAVYINLGTAYTAIARCKYATVGTDTAYNLAII